jgi:hypothetical protein
MAHFVAAVEPTLVAFLTLVIPALGLWIVNQLNANHAATVAAAKESTTAVAAVSQKVDSIDTKASSIVHATDGINTGLRETIAAQQTTAEHLAVVNNYRAQIAELTKKVNGGT